MQGTSWERFNAASGARVSTSDIACWVAALCMYSQVTSVGHSSATDQH